MPDSIDVAIAMKMKQLSHIAEEVWGMRRDMELVRDILRAVMDKPDLKPQPLKVDGREEGDVLGRHIEMLFEAGYIKGIKYQAVSDHYAVIFVTDLSWEGHEFAGALLTDDGVWEKVKTALGPDKLATVPLKMIQSVATAALTAWGLKQLGL